MRLCVSCNTVVQPGIFEFSFGAYVCKECKAKGITSKDNQVLLDKRFKEITLKTNKSKVNQ